MYPIDTSPERPCETCEGTGMGMGNQNECLVCEGKGKFPGFDLKQIFALILTKGKGSKRTLRKHFPKDPGLDDTLSARAFFVWTRAQAIKNGARPSTFAELGVSGDPYRSHLEKIAEVVSDTFFGTSKPKGPFLGAILPHLDSLRSELRK